MHGECGRCYGAWVKRWLRGGVIRYLRDEHYNSVGSEEPFGRCRLAILTNGPRSISHDVLSKWNFDVAKGGREKGIETERKREKQKG